MPQLGTDKYRQVPRIYPGEHFTACNRSPAQDEQVANYRERRGRRGRQRAII
jgi:hypothetical protein